MGVVLLLLVGSLVTNNISALNWGYIIELNMEESVCEGRKAEILMMKERYLI